MTDDAPTRPLPVVRSPPGRPPPSGYWCDDGRVRAARTRRTPRYRRCGDTADAASAAPASTSPASSTRPLSKSGLLWVRVPGGGGTHAVWHVWHDDGDDRGHRPAAYVVSGPGEQSLPWLPDEVELILRSKDTGGRLLTVHATAREVTPEDDGWDAAVEVLRPERLNAVGDVAAAVGGSRARSTCSPRTAGPSSGPGSYGDDSGAAPVRPAAGATSALAALALARPGRRPPQHPRLTAAREVPGPRRARPDSLSG